MTLARQGNERENEIISNQTSLVDAVWHRRRCGTRRTLGLEFASEEQFAPTLTGLGTRAPVSIYNPNPFDPVTGFAPARDRRLQPRDRRTRSALYAFDTVDVGDASGRSAAGCAGSTTTRRSRRSMRPASTTTDLRRADGLVSGKAGVLFRLTEHGQRLRLVRHDGDAARHGELHAERAAEQPEQPERGAAGVDELRSRQQGRLLRQPAVADGAVFRTDNKNVIFTVDAAAVPPIFNQDDEQRVNGVTLGALGQITPQLAGARELRLPRHQRRSARTPPTTASA